MKTVFDVIRQPLVIGALVLSILIVVGVYFGSHWYYGDVEPVKMLAVSAPTPPKNLSTSEIGPDLIGGESLPPQTESTPTVSSAEGELTDDFLTELSEEEKALLAAEVSEEAKREFYNSIGLDPPPPGHTYLWDGDGNARLVRYNEPLVEVDWTQQGYGNFSQLSDEEFDRYNALAAITDQTTARSLRIPANVVELAREWKNELYQKTWGSKPTIQAATVYNRPITLTDSENKSRLLEEKYLDVLPSPRRFSVNYDIVNQLIIELTLELGQDSQGILTIYE